MDGHTQEVVRALRCREDALSCSICRYRNETSCHETVEFEAANLLEQLSKEIEVLSARIHDLYAKYGGDPHD